METRQLFETIAVGTNIAMGFPLEESLAMLADIGVKHVELSCIAGMCEHIEPQRMDPEYAGTTLRMLEKYGLDCPAVAGHVDLTREAQLRDFLKKMEFAGRIGARYINTNSGPLERFDIFLKNMDRVIEQAEKWNVIVCLESHGDIIGTARESAAHIARFQHPLVRMNYDTGNTYFYEKGEVDIADDLAYSRDVLAYMHIKDVKIRGNRVDYTAIGEGDLNFNLIFRRLLEMGRTIPASLEIPVFVGGTLDGIGPQDPPLSQEHICQTVRKSYEFVTQVISTL